MKRQILFVDCEKHLVDGLIRLFRARGGNWRISRADGIRFAWDHWSQNPLDAAVLDFTVAGEDGFRLLARAKADSRTLATPILVLTAGHSVVTERRLMELGVTDVLAQPVAVGDLWARLVRAVQIKIGHDELKALNAALEQRVCDGAEQLLVARLELVWRLGRIAEFRDGHGRHHVVRVGSMSRAIGRVLGMPCGSLERLSLVAPLHDFGKIGIPEAILAKPAPLSPAQWTVMRQHCEIGAELLRTEPALQGLFREWRGAQYRPVDHEKQDSLLATAAAVALTHHEQWNGGGYPRGLAGEEIPLESRIVAIADAFDSLTSARPYRGPYREDQALEILARQTPSHFDPAVHAAFLEAWPAIQAIRERFADAPPPAAGDEPVGAARPSLWEEVVTQYD
ncbi:MAG: HD domain-containing phosphohydrolase [Thermoguttaceae bacterium]